MHSFIFVANTEENEMVSDSHLFELAEKYSSGAIDDIDEMSKRISEMIDKLQGFLGSQDIEVLREGNTIRINYQDVLKNYVQQSRRQVEAALKNADSSKDPQDLAFVFDDLAYRLNDKLGLIVYSVEDDVMTPIQLIHRRLMPEDGYIVLNIVQVFDYHY